MEGDDGEALIFSIVEMYRCSDGGKKRVCPEDGSSGEHIGIC